jgi:hypothetical protein
VAGSHAPIRQCGRVASEVNWRRSGGLLAATPPRGPTTKGALGLWGSASVMSCWLRSCSGMHAQAPVLIQTFVRKGLLRRN